MALESSPRDMVGKVNYLLHAYKRDADRALKMANIQPRDRVLDVFCAGARITGKAKLAAGPAGTVVGLDCVPGFLTIDAPARLASIGFQVAPARNLATATQVHLVEGIVTDDNIPEIIERHTGAPAVYDVILFVDHFDRIQATQHRAALHILKSMLSDHGRIITNITALFPTDTGAGCDDHLPPQFRSGSYTKAIGCVLASVIHQQQTSTTADGTVVPVLNYVNAIQMAPDRFWTEAKQQAFAVAKDIDLRICQMNNIGMGSKYGLPEEMRSPPGTHRMTIDELTDLLGQVPPIGYHCCGRIHEALAYRLSQGQDTMSDSDRDLVLITLLQQLAEQITKDYKERDDDRRLRALSLSPCKVYTLPVGIMVLLAL